MRALVTGGKGFIGSHLVKRLKKEGWEVVIVDLPEWDVTVKEDWEILLPKIDYVFHLAGHLDNYGEETDFGRYVDINVKSIALMFEVIVEKKLPIKKILVASSQSIYGNNPFLETEKDPPTPISLYGASKAAMEDILFMLGKLYEIPTIAMRYSIVLGPGQKFKDLDSRILPCFVAMAKGGKITTHEDGRQLRDFIHVDDLVDAHIFLTKRGNGIINIGSGKITSVNAVASYIANKYGVKVSHTGKRRINTARVQIMDIGKIKRLGWFPKRSWEEAADDYINSLS